MADPIIELLHEIRDEARAMRNDDIVRRADARSSIRGMRDEMQHGFARMNRRLDDLEVELRGLVCQAMELTREIESRHERRIAELERRLGP